MQFLVVNRKRPEKLRYEVVPWSGKAADSGAAAVAVAHTVLPAHASSSRPSDDKGRRAAKPPHRFRRMFNWPAVPDFIVTLMTAASKIFGRHS